MFILQPMCGCYFLVWVHSFVNTALLSSCGPFLRSLQTLLASNQPTLVLHRFLPHLLCPSVLSVCQRGFVVHLLLLIPCFVFRHSSTCKCPMSICLILPTPSFLDVYEAAELSHQIHGVPTFKPNHSVLDFGQNLRCICDPASTTDPAIGR